MADAWLQSRVPPVVVTLITAVLMWLLARSTPALDWKFPGHVVLAGVLAGLGVLAMVAGVVEFRRAGTTLDPLSPGKAGGVVSTGIYRLSRNPMYLGMLLVLMAWAALMANPVAALALPLFVLFMNRYQVIPEERALVAKFGAPYSAYLKAVRRWL